MIGSAIAGLVVGCVGDIDDELGSSEQYSETDNRLAGNRLAGNRLAANRLAGNGLSAASTDLAAMAGEASGRELLSYLISCALPRNKELVVGDHVFPGQVGLAPFWMDRALSTDERRWVSACVLARVNAFDVSVALSMRGTHGALRASLEERDAYTLYEGAFWGDIFDGAWHACTSSYKLTAPQVSTMPLRACTVDDGTGSGVTRCGFQFAGICEDVCSGTPGLYASCASGVFAGQLLDATQTVSVFLAGPTIASLQDTAKGDE